MQNESIGHWLGELASSAPAPGGGAAAALEAAIAAALVEMVCNLTIGKPAYAEHEATMIAARDRAAAQRKEALRLAAEDATAFRAVTDSYKLPKGTDAEVAIRSARIQEALAGAADVPRRTAETAGTILDLAETILLGANVNVLSDVAVAAASAHAALESARVNIDVNRSAISSPEVREELTLAAAGIDAELVRAEAIVAKVRDRING